MLDEPLIVWIELQVFNELRAKSREFSDAILKMIEALGLGEVEWF
jgi:hypothetical protein